MLVVVANHLPPAVRGRMKLWFIEPKPNIFISGIKDRTAEEVVAYLSTYCPQESGLMIFRKISKSPGYKIYSFGETTKKIVKISGLQLIEEKQDLEEYWKNRNKRKQR
jgi:CRISPR-associated protein Cas2